MKIVNKSSRVPYYYQLAEILRQMIAAKGEGISIPSENELARVHQLSRATVRQAMDMLEREGLIYRARGIGTFAAKPRARYELTELIPTTDELIRRGWIPSVQVISSHLIAAPSHVAQGLELDTDEQVYELCRLRLGNNQPVSIQWSYLPSRLYPALPKHDLTGSLTHLIEEHYGLKLWRAREVLRARLATVSEAKLLQISAQVPVIYMERVTVSPDGLPLEFLESVWRSDLYDFEFTLVREIK